MGIRLADFFTAGQEGRQAARDDKARKSLASYMQGDQSALAGVYANDPQAAMDAQTFQGNQKKQAEEQFGKLSTVYAQTRDPNAYGQWRQAGIAAGHLPQDTPERLTDPADMEGSAKTAQAYAQAFGGGGQDGTPAAIRELQMLQANPKLYEMDIARRQAGWQPKTINTSEGMAVFTPQDRSAAPLNYGGPPQAPQPGMYQTPQGIARIGDDLSPEQREAAMADMSAGGNTSSVTLPQRNAGPRVMAPLPTSDNKPSALQERLALASQMGASDDEKRQMVIGKEGAAAGAKPMPVAALKIIKEETDAANTATAINTSLDKHLGRIQSGKLDFGPIANQIYAGRNASGMSTEESRNFAEFKSDLEKLRNDSLRLNNGVQTDGDAQRAWNELVANINDTEYVKQRLQTIKGLNERARNLRMLNADMIRENYGRGEGSEQAAPAQSAPKRLKYNPATGRLE